MDEEISIIDIGKKKIIVKMPADMFSLSSYSVKWTFDFRILKGKHPSSSSQKTFPIKTSGGEILISRDPYTLLAEPGSEPMCFIILKIFGCEVARKSSKRQPDELNAICDYEGLAKIYSEPKIAECMTCEPISKEFNMAEMIGKKSFKKIMSQARSFLLREKQ